jgi:uncharacterized protein YraI
MRFANKTRQEGISMSHRAPFGRLIALILITALTVSTIALSAPSVLAQDSPVVVVDTGAINIRSGPAPNTVSLGSVYGGTELPVTGRNASNTWWRVDSPFGIGWVAADLVAFQGNRDAVPIVSEPVGTLEQPMVFVEGYPATVYRNPNYDSFVIGIVPTGVSLPAVGRSNDGNWWQVQTSMGLGWINITEVVLRGDGTLVPRVGDPGPSFVGPTIRVNTDVTVTSEPGGGTTVATLSAGTAIPANGRSADNTWWQVAGDFGWGWIPVDNVSLAGSAENIPVAANTYIPGPGYTGAAFATAVVESNRKVAYADYNFSSDPMWDARLGEQMSVIARNPTGLWLEVVKSNGWTGWMNFSGLTLNGSMAGIPIKDTTPIIRNIVIVNVHRLHLRAGPGAQYVSLWSFPGGAELDVTGRHPTLPWIRVEGPWGVGWVRILYIIFRGDWNAVPIVTEPVGDLEMPLAIINTPHHIYAEPNYELQLGSIAPDLYTIIGWSPYYEWALIQTPLGDGWIHSDEFEIRGFVDNAPIIP